MKLFNCLPIELMLIIIMNFLKDITNMKLNNQHLKTNKMKVNGSLNLFLLIQQNINQKLNQRGRNMQNIDLYSKCIKIDRILILLPEILHIMLKIKLLFKIQQFLKRGTNKMVQIAANLLTVSTLKQSQQLVQAMELKLGKLGLLSRRMIVAILIKNQV